MRLDDIAPERNDLLESHLVLPVQIAAQGGDREIGGLDQDLGKRLCRLSVAHGPSFGLKMDCDLGAQKVTKAPKSQFTFGEYGLEGKSWRGYSEVPFKATMFEASPF